MTVSFPPAPMRLTLSKEAFVLLPKIVPKSLAWLGVSRPDGKWEVPVSPALYDQLQTAALPKENLSDTVLRLAMHRKD